MLKLYISPGACSLSPHIAMREAGLHFELEKVDLSAKKTEGGVDFKTINPKGYVPALQLADGQILTEGPVILQYILDQAPAAAITVASGSMARYRVLEWVNYVSTEIHKSFSPLFNPAIPEEWKALSKKMLGVKFDFLNTHLAQHPYLIGDTFSVADGYLFTVLRWTRVNQIELSGWPALQQFFEQVRQRPTVQSAMEAEGIKNKN